MTVSRLTRSGPRRSSNSPSSTISGREMSSRSRSAIRPATACSLRSPQRTALDDRRARGVEGARPRAQDGRVPALPRGLRLAQAGVNRHHGSRSRSRSPTTPFSSRKHSTRRRASSRTSSAPCGTNGGWASTFTQEWPAPVADAPVFLHRCVSQWRRDVGLRRHPHQLSIPGIGRRPGRVAFSPRVSLILPTGSATTGSVTASPDCSSTCR